MTERGFIGHIATLVASIHCGHTTVYPSRGLMEHLRRRRKLFPVPIRISARRCFAAQEYGGEGGVPQGSEILSLNGRSGTSVIETMLSCVNGDGHTTTGRLRKIEKRFGLYFDRYIEQAEAFHLRYITPGGETGSLTVHGIGRGQLEADPQDETPPVGFSIDQPGRVAVLHIRTFYTVAWRRHHLSPRRYLRDFFRRLAEHHVDNLIIDIRGNEGGSVFLAADLLAHFADEDIRWCREYRVSAATRLTYPDTLQWDPFATFKWLVTRRLDDHRVYPWYRLLRKTKIARDFHFSGRVFLLVDGRTSSAASMFASMAEECDRVVTLGEETGGTACGNGVSPVTVVLPHTRVRMDLAFGYVVLDRPGEAREGRGVIPEYGLRPRPEGHSTQDSVLSFTIGLASRRGRASEALLHRQPMTDPAEP